MTELNLVLSDISLASSNIEKWTAPQHVAKDLVNSFNTAFILAELYGVILIVSPWNYPLLLTLQPLVGVIAAGKYHTRVKALLAVKRGVKNRLL